MNLGDILMNGEMVHPYAVAIVQGSLRLTYGQARRDVHSIAGHLWDAGLRPGDVVATDLQRPVSHWLVLLALMRLGATSVSLTAQSEAEIRELPDLAAVVRAEGEAGPSGPGPRTIELGRRWLREPAATSDLPSPDLAGTAAGRIAFTSGTAGRPKAIELTAPLLSARLDGTGLRTRITARTVLWCGLGPDTAYGYTATLATWAAGGTVVLARGGTGDFAAMAKLGVNLLVASPAALAALLRDAAANNLPVLEAEAIAAGGRLPVGERDALLRRLCRRVWVAYGASESGGVTLGDAAGLDIHPGRVGQAFSDVRLRIVDESGIDLPAGSVGRLLVQTPSLVAGYRNSPEATGDHFIDGWFASGDRAQMGPDGVLTILGRPANSLNLGGVKLNAEDVDALARAQPGVQDAAAVVVQVQGTEQLAIVISGQVADPGVFAAALHGAMPQLPAFLLVASPALPRGSMGKVNRQDLTARLQASLDGAPDAMLRMGLF